MKSVGSPLRRPAVLTVLLALPGLSGWPAVLAVGSLSLLFVPNSLPSEVPCV